ncbi:MAG: endolytic transglycosylase MltG [bacterium]
MRIFFIGLFLLAGLGILAGAFYLYPILFAPAVPAHLEKTDFIIARGMSVAQIADSLERQSFIRAREHFLLAARLTRWQNQLQAGKYQIVPRASHVDLLKLFRSGKVTPQRVTLPEGRPAEDYAEILQRELALDKTAFLSLVEDSAFALQLGVPAKRLEGYLYPNTYYFLWGVTPAEVITVLVRELQKNLTDSVRAQIAAQGLTLHQVMTLAAIVEGEAVIDSERAVIAAVYRNRLQQGILLQADPTIQYVVPGPPRRLLHHDLEIDSPYNTYRRSGLPPGPVNNPSIKSVLAVLNPAPVHYIYFVARGEGSHRFSYTLQQHLQAKREFDMVREQVRRDQKRKAVETGRKGH